MYCYTGVPSAGILSGIENRDGGVGNCDGGFLTLG